MVATRSTLGRVKVQRMIDHLGITVSDIERSKAFYAEALGTLGYVLCKDTPGAVSFGVREGHGKSADPGGDFWLSEGTPMTPRVHFAFNAASRLDVDAFFAASLAAGGAVSSLSRRCPVIRFKPVAVSSRVRRHCDRRASARR